MDTGLLGFKALDALVLNTSHGTAIQDLNFPQILLFQPGLCVKSVPCLLLHPGLKPPLLNSKL